MLLRIVVMCVVVTWKSRSGGAWLLQGTPGFKELLQNLKDSVFTCAWPTTYNLRDGEVFDYIVVGGGGAGCAAAAKLALCGHSVLLVEAGGNPNLLTTIPAAAMALLGSDQDWQYRTIPNNKSCLSSEGQQCRFSRGKCLGGSTSINYMMYVRGNRLDYDLGIPGWTWDDLEPYFLRYEGLRDLDKLPPSSKPYHNMSGNMQIEFFDDPHNEWQSRIIKGMKSLNIPFNPDVNAQSQIGVSKVVGYVYRGKRMSTACGYLAQADVRRRLAVTKSTHCTGIVIDDNNVARGVTVVRNSIGKELTLYVKKEVILSAGTIGTPQILLLSGIGPAEHLKSFGIPMRADLPVGDNMSDHVLPLVFIRVRRSLFKQGLDLADKAANIVQYVTNSSGFFASNGLTDTTAFINSRCYDPVRRKLLMENPDCEQASLQLINAYIDRGLVSIGKPIFKQSTLLTDDIISQLAAMNAKDALIVASPVVLQPCSRGNVRLASTDPLDNPAIFPNYLGNERDIDEMIRAITILEHLVETPAYRAGGASIVHLNIEGCPRYEENKDGYWRCYVRHLTFSVYHAVGTAALGAVVDEQLRVRGVRGLRVADLSVLPQIPRGNTAAVAIALGERVVYFLLCHKK